MFHPELDDDDFYYFNVQLDEHNLSIVVDGSQKNNLNIIVSSKKLLNNLQHLKKDENFVQKKKKGRHRFAKKAFIRE